MRIYGIMYVLEITRKESQHGNYPLPQREL